MVDASMDGPEGTIKVTNLGFERSRDVVDAKEVLEFLRLNVIGETTGVHASNDRRHVPEHHRVHQRYK